MPFINILFQYVRNPVGPRKDLNLKLFLFYFFFRIVKDFFTMYFWEEKTQYFFTLTDIFSISLLTIFQNPETTLKGAAMVATNITSCHTRIIPSRKERDGEVLEQSGEMSNAGGALPWSIQQRSHTPPSPDVDPRTYTRTTAGSVCAPSRHSCLSIPSPICLHAPLLCRPIPSKEHNTLVQSSQASEATVVQIK